MDAAIAKQYRLTDPFPTTWSDPIEDNQLAQRKTTRASTARYSVLQEEGMSIRSSGGALDAAVPQDEADPLGTTNSVVRVLRQRGLAVDDNLRLRNRYLISSKTFSPAAFLRDVHSNDTTEVLSRGLEFLSRSIDQKSESLKVLVESNFDRFVAAKATIEGVYTEMKQTNLNKEQEWGLAGIKTPLTDAGKKADEIFGPVMENRGKEEKYRNVLGLVEKHKAMLEIPNLIIDAIKRKDYDLLIEEYQKARRWVGESRALVTKVNKPQETQLYQIVIAEKIWAEVGKIVEEFKRDTWRRLVDTRQEDNFLELISILLELGVEDNPIWVWLLSRYDYLKNKLTRTFERARMEIEALRRKVSLLPPPSNATIAIHLRSSFRRSHPPNSTLDTPEILALWELIHTSLTTILSPQGGILSEVLTFWETASNFIDGKTQATLPVGIDDQSRKHHRLSDDGVKDLRAGAIELITILRDNMVTLFQDPPIEDISSIYSPMPDTPGTPANAPNTPSMAPFSPIPTPTSVKRAGVKREGDEYAFLPPGANSLGGVHYLSRILTLLGNAACLLAELPVGTSTVEKLKSMIVIARERCVHAVCIGWLRDAQNCKVLEDWTRSPDNRDVTKLPSQFLQVESAIINGMQKLLYLNEVKHSPSSEIIPPPSTKLLTHVRSQFVKSLYKALQGMLETAKRPLPLEEWDAEKELLASPTASVAPTPFFSAAGGGGGGGGGNGGGAGGAAASAAAVAAAAAAAAGQGGMGGVDMNDKNVRVLLTLSNITLLKTTLIPTLLEKFETCFSSRLTEESKVIKDALGQLDTRLFEEYTKPHVAAIREGVRDAVLASSFGSPSTTVAGGTGGPAAGQLKVNSYVHNALLHIVTVHAETSRISPSLTRPVVVHLVDILCTAMLDAFTERLDVYGRKFNVRTLLQVTLDVEFVNQTLSTTSSSSSSTSTSASSSSSLVIAGAAGAGADQQAGWMSDKAKEKQKEVYLLLDRGSGVEEREGLQRELRGVKEVLSRERKGSRAEFLCFRGVRARRAGGDAGGGGGVGGAEEKKDGKGR